MTTTELILNMLAKQLQKYGEYNKSTRLENKKVAKRGGSIAGNARKGLNGKPESLS